MIVVNNEWQAINYKTSYRDKEGKEEKGYWHRP